MTQEELFNKMKNEHKVTINGAVLLGMANIFMERQTILNAVVEVSEEMGEKNEEVERKAQVNEAIGAYLFAKISEVFGMEFLEKFAEGDVDFPEPPSIMGGNETVN